MPKRPDSGQPQPHCAICRGDSAVCGHEDDRLKQALHESQTRWLAEGGMQAIRHWVLNRARDMILYTYQNLAAQRQQQYEAHLSTLQGYNLYIIYRGSPPLPPDQLHRLTVEMQQAREYLQQNLDTDWAACLQKYPDTLDYFFSLIDATVPEDDDPRVEQPVITGAPVPGEKKKRKKGRHREGYASAPPMPTGQAFGYGRYGAGPPMHGGGGGIGPFAGPGFPPY